jgi:hypothetical protein
MLRIPVSTSMHGRPYWQTQVTPCCPQAVPVPKSRVPFSRHLEYMYDERQHSIDAIARDVSRSGVASLQHYNRLQVQVRGHPLWAVSFHR